MSLSGGPDGFSGEGLGGLFELGPEGKMTGLNDQDIVLKAVNQFLGDERYTGHNERIIKKLDEYDLSTSGLGITVALHDVVDHGLMNPKDEKESQRTQQFLDGLYEQVEDKDQFIYALGCAISTGFWEAEIGEGWRYSGPEAFTDKTVGERQQITAAIERNNSIEIDETVLKSAMPDQIEIDTSALRHAMQERDVEGLIVKAAELLDNLDNPPPSNPASTWRDCVEIIKCYAPALELFGFKDLAGELAGKAYEYFYGDDEEIREKAQTQHELSQRYFDFIKDATESVVTEVLREMPGGEEIRAGIEITGRVKSEGSIMKKLHDNDYVKAGADVVPDGIGLRLILPDNLDAEQIIEIGDRIRMLFTESWMGDVPDPEFRAKHPIDESPVDESIENPRDYNYSAYHLALQYLATEEGSPIAVPAEIQLVTSTQERLHTYDEASHVLYKTGTARTPQIVEDLRQIELRAEHLRNKPLNQELNPHIWPQILKLAPELNTPIHRAYKLIETDDARVMVPSQLASGLNVELFSEAGLEGEVILPPAHLEMEEFFELIGLIDPALKNSEKIRNAIELIKEREDELSLRRNGNNVLEGHLLPAAFHAGALTALTAKHWDSDDPNVYLETIITEALLHDMVEDTSMNRSDIDTAFDENIGDTVYAMTSPGIIKNEHLRRTIYAWKIESDEDAPFIKLSDRGQNHLTDLVLLAIAGANEEELKKVKDYFKKTETYLEPIFENPEKMPKEYRQVYTAIKAIKRALL